MTYYWNFEFANIGRIFWRMLVATEAEAKAYETEYNKTANGKKHPVRLIKDAEYRKEI